jgi:hypothetical protein
MKKILLLILSIFMLTACKQDKFYLEDKYYENNEIIDTTHVQIDELFTNKESFVAIVYLPGCTSCVEFRKVVDQFRETNNIVFYNISIEEEKQTELSNKIKYAPSAVIVKEGKIIDYLDTTKNEHIPYYETKEGFTSWLEQYIYLQK